jgi:signal transduction histidine kinase
MDIRPYIALRASSLYVMYRTTMDVLPSPVSWARLTAFVRQLGHDIRNDLNALSLEAALLKELVADPEAVTSATRIQSQLRDIANRLKELSGRYTLPAPQVGPVSVVELGPHLQNAIVGDALEWELAGDGQVQTDAALLVRAFRELAQNAIERAKAQKPKATLAAIPGGGAVLALRELSDEYPWPDSAFETPKAGHYGAGLPIAAAILRGLGHSVERKKSGDVLETRIILAGV